MFAPKRKPPPPATATGGAASDPCGDAGDEGAYLDHSRDHVRDSNARRLVREPFRFQGDLRQHRLRFVRLITRGKLRTQLR
jgi:hypothetical protein